MLAVICSITVALEIWVCSPPQPSDQVAKVYPKMVETWMKSESEKKFVGAPMMIRQTDPEWSVVIWNARELP